MHCRGQRARGIVPSVHGVHVDVVREAKGKACAAIVAIDLHTHSTAVVHQVKRIQQRLHLVRGRVVRNTLTHLRRAVIGAKFQAVNALLLIVARIQELRSVVLAKMLSNERASVSTDDDERFIRSCLQSSVGRLSYRLDSTSSKESKADKRAGYSVRAIEAVGDVKSTVDK